MANILGKRIKIPRGILGVQSGSIANLNVTKKNVIRITPISNRRS